MTTFVSSTGITTLTYPRTGKRGVPQQFPRRLYEMLESEARLIQTDPEHRTIITWSDSGKAFRIKNVALFASHVLPKYFRTSKFSSFQRNLNLYGFSKVRRGPDTDMYAHPAFVRGQPESLSHLRKCNSTAARKRLAAAGNDNQALNKILIPSHSDVLSLSRTVSPSPRGSNEGVAYSHIMPMPSSGSSNGATVFMPTVWLPTQVTTPQFPMMSMNQSHQSSPSSSFDSSSFDSGRLNLLAMAMTSLADRDAQFSAVAPLKTA